MTSPVLLPISSRPEPPMVLETVKFPPKAWIPPPSPVSVIWRVRVGELKLPARWPISPAAPSEMALVPIPSEPSLLINR